MKYFEKRGNEGLTLAILIAAVIHLMLLLLFPFINKEGKTDETAVNPKTLVEAKLIYYKKNAETAKPKRPQAKSEITAESIKSAVKIQGKEAAAEKKNEKNETIKRTEINTPDNSRIIIPQKREEEKIKSLANEIKVKNRDEEAELQSGDEGIPEGIEISGLSVEDGTARWVRGDMPKYPDIAQQNGWSGTVALLLSLDKNGNVKNTIIKQKSGYSILDEAAKKKSLSWKIQIEYNGMKIEGNVLIKLKFVLR